jgi:hypothetical protein
LRAGEGVSLLEGNIIADFADGTQFPGDASYEFVQ